MKIRLVELFRAKGQELADNIRIHRNLQNIRGAQLVVDEMFHGRNALAIQADGISLVAPSSTALRYISKGPKWRR